MLFVYLIAVVVEVVTRRRDSECQQSNNQTVNTKPPLKET